MRALLLSAVVLLLAAGCGEGEEQAAQGPSALEAQPWVLHAGLDVPGWEEVAPSAIFADGRLAGSTGCNRYSTSYAVDGDALELEQLVSTKIACIEPAGAVEQAFLAAMERVSHWRVTGEELVLRDGDEEVLRFLPANPLGTWKATSFLHPGAVKSPLAGTEITAVFAMDGALSGSAGCNRYTATWTASPMTITEVAATEMACSQPEGVMEQERAYLDALPKAASYSVEGSTLTLLTKEGTIVATYTRAG